MDIQTAEKLGRDLIGLTEVAIVTTVDQDGLPQSRAMFNLRNPALFPGLRDCFDDGLLLYFTTNTSSSKVSHIQNNNLASVYFCRPGDWRGFNLSGTMSVSDNSDLKQRLWQENWTMYYPGGYSDPDYSVLIFEPSSASYYHQLEYLKWSIKEAE